MKTAATLTILASAASAFPFVALQPGVDSSLFSKRQQAAEGAGSEKKCPFNPNHVPAAPITSQYPYNGAINGQKGNEKGGYRVPAPGDTAHKFIAPNPKTDIRGPCPGLNALANHNFLARDGITTFDELVDAQQNVYNVGHDLAQTLALLGLTLTDGDIVTEKLSIGCDATSRTSYNPTLTGHEPGLAGHNKFEGDTSLAHNDFFLDHGNDFAFNGTLFGMMTKSTGGLYNLKNLANYRFERYHQSLRDNPNFYFGPLALLLFGAASFLYELFPNGNHDFKPDVETISSFFGTKKNANGRWVESEGSRIPHNWTNRVSPYNNNDVTHQILAMYQMHPVLFGGVVGNGNFDATDFGGIIKNGKLDPNITPQQTTCLLFQLLTERVPSGIGGVVTEPTLAALNLILGKVGPTFENLGCPQPVTK